MINGKIIIVYICFRGMKVMWKCMKSSRMKIVVVMILSITLILILVLFYWLPRVTLEISNEARYILPPSKEKFISDVVYISKRKGIYSTQEIKKFDYQEKYNGYSDAVLDLSSYLAENYGKHAEIFKYENNDAKYEKYVNLPIVSIDSDKIASITLPGFSGKVSDEKKYIMTVQNFLKTNKNEIEGIIIDLSTNYGGNLDVLIASLTQLLPKGTLFNFVDNENNKFPVELMDNKINYDDHSYSIDSQEKLEIPVVVIGSNLTASSAEILLLTIISNIENSVFIGQPTGGFLSGREGFKLYDDYYLGLPTRSIETNEGINHKTDEPIRPFIESQDLYNEAKRWLDNIINQ